MFARRLAAACLLILAGTATTAPATILSDPADAIVTELNRVRADPSAYARELQRYRGHFAGRIVRDPGEPVDRLTMEGVRALDEAVAVLRDQPPVGPLSPVGALAVAASDHVRDEGPSGIEGHVGRNGSDPLDRVMRRGMRPFVVGEVIAYGPSTAAEVVRELIIDDGVADRGHRHAIFNPQFARAGAACGPHLTYRIMCVVDLASATDAPAGARRIAYR